MAQGLIKKGAKPVGSSHKAKKLVAASGATGAPKRGARVTKAPRTAKAIKTHASTNKMMRQFTSGLTAKTEAMLGQRAGHLELIGPGKKKGVQPGADKEQKNQKNQKNCKSTTGIQSQKGGSRKFG